jgi:hypothetical protein
MTNKKRSEKLKDGIEEAAEATKSLGKSVVDVSVEVGRAVIDVGKDVGKTSIDIGKKIGRGFRRFTSKVAGAVDITCDNCNRLMRPGFLAYKVTIGYRDYQFCCEYCANEFTRKWQTIAQY